MKPGSGKDLSTLYEQRRRTRDVEIFSYNEVEDAIKGNLPSEYQRLFTTSDVKLQLRTIRSADDSLTKFLAEIPVLPHAEIAGKRDSQTARNKAELVEKIMVSYYDGLGVGSFKGIAHQLARYQVRFGDGVILLHPNHQRRSIYLEVKDPRCFYPPTGWTPWSITPLDGALLVYEMTLGEVKQRYAYDEYKQTIPDVMGKLNNAFSSRYSSSFEVDDTQMVKVAFYRSKEAWYIAALQGLNGDVVLMQSETGDKDFAGVCGVVSFKQFESEPLFLGQIGIEAYLEKVANQQVQNTERINKASLVGPPLVNDEFKVGGYSTIDFSSPLAQKFGPPVRLAPDSPGNLNQVMLTFLQLSHLFNYNPESTMGGGEAVSGKAINALQAGARTHVTNILWAPYEVAFPRLHDEGMRMELNLWPNERKTAAGLNGRQSFSEEYTPSSAFKDHVGLVRIEAARAGGYNAFLEGLQKKEGDLASQRTVMELDPDIKDVEAELRRMELEHSAKRVRAAFEALGQMDPFRALELEAEVRRRMEKGQSEADVLIEMSSEGLLKPPAPPDAMAGGMPPIPPELMGALGGGAEDPMASLTSARGF